MTDLHDIYIFSFLLGTYSADYILGRGISYFSALKLRLLLLLLFSLKIDPDGDQVLKYAAVRHLVSITACLLPLWYINGTVNTRLIGQMCQF